jgi:hypothetical protein
MGFVFTKNESLQAQLELYDKIAKAEEAINDGDKGEDHALT